MAEPTKEAKQQEYYYQTDQQVSVNAFFDVQIGIETYRMQVTSRYGSTAEKVVSTTEALIEALSILREKHPRPLVEAMQQTGSPAPERKSYEVKPVPASEVPEELPSPSEGGMDYFKDEFDEIEIIPQPDNKASVKFYKYKMKYPVGAPINKWKNDSVAKILAPLGEFDPTKAVRKRVAGVQFWTQGNAYTNDKGETKHYKDLRLVQASL